ncbi:hypothetical protein GCM10018966_072390 [Streptomyces yanii]
MAGSRLSRGDRRREMRSRGGGPFGCAGQGGLRKPAAARGGKVSDDREREDAAPRKSAGRGQLDRADPRALPQRDIRPSEGHRLRDPTGRVVVVRQNSRRPGAR